MVVELVCLTIRIVLYYKRALYYNHTYWVTHMSDTQAVGHGFEPRPHH